MCVCVCVCVCLSVRLSVCVSVEGVWWVVGACVVVFVVVERNQDDKKVKVL